jgi:glycosyltransferase involved in cell wall biosynthesis
MTPLVSCICITKNRRLFLRRAVSYFERARSEFLRGCPKGEGWCELIVLDGSESSSERLRINDGSYGDGLFLDEVAGLRYFHEPASSSQMGADRNRACELARGDIILHWDDDDWQSPDRIEACVRTLREGPQTAPYGPPRENGALAFTSQFYAYHLAERRAARWRSWGRGGSLGATFAYHKKVWEAAPFRENAEEGEDNFFWDDQTARGTAMVDMTDPTLLVYMRHNRNGSAFISEGATNADTEAARAILGADLPFYDELSEILPLDVRCNPYARSLERVLRRR